MVIWDNRTTQHETIDGYGDERRMVRRITIDGPVSVGIDGRHGRRRNSDMQIAAAALESGSANDRLCPTFP